MIALAEHAYVAAGRNFQFQPETIRVLMVTDAYPEDDRSHYVHSDPCTVAWQNTQRIFAEAGVGVSSFQGLLDRGVLMEPCLEFVKPARISPWHIRSGAVRIAEWIGGLPNLRAVALMGDVAIRCFNEMARPRLASGRRLIPADYTYRVRGDQYLLGPLQIFPTYLHTCESFNGERAKQRALAADMERLVRHIR